jgi:osmotically-inducible protein OsmY
MRDRAGILLGGREEPLNAGSWSRSHRLRLAVLGSLCLAACSLSTTYGKCGFSGCPGDAEIGAHVRALLYARPELASADLAVQALDHVVYLRGLVDTDLQRAEVVARVRALPGVRDVVDGIAVRNHTR